MSDDIDRNAVLRFGAFRLDRRSGLSRLSAAGHWQHVELGSRARDVLVELVEGRGELVTKQTLMDVVWPGMAVEESNLSAQISALRRVLDETRIEGSCIQTVIGRGYRFVIPIESPVAVAGETATPAPADASPPPSVPEAATSKRRFPPPSMVAVAVLTVFLAAGASWVLRGAAEPPVITAAAPARPEAYSPQDRRKSVIVLPFENSSGDAAQDAVAADLTRDLTEVVADDTLQPTVPAATAASYRGRVIDLRVIGREHDVHFALTGNARRQDGRLIVAAAVYETSSARQIWAGRFDRPGTPDVWKQIIREIGDGYDHASQEAELARAMQDHPDHLDKRELMFAVFATPLLQGSKANLLTQIALTERALALDPDYVIALHQNARKHADLVLGGFSSDPDADLAIARKSAERALQLKPDDYWTLREKAVVLSAQRNYNEAAALLRRLIERKPLAAMRHMQLGNIMIIQGQHKEALESFTTARRLAVGTDSVNALDANVAIGLLANGRFPEAIEQARLAITEFPPESGRSGEVPWLVLIAAESGNGQEIEARADLKKFLATPRTLSSMSELMKSPYYAANPNLLNGLRQAGMPDE